MSTDPGRHPAATSSCVSAASRPPVAVASVLPVPLAVPVPVPGVVPFSRRKTGAPPGLPPVNDVWIVPYCSFSALIISLDPVTMPMCSLGPHAIRSPGSGEVVVVHPFHPSQSDTTGP
jgi:hypothetical protein